MKLLRAGGLQMQYDNGFLRYITAGNYEVIRMIYFALRDENWGTYPPLIHNEKIEVEHESFSIQYECTHEKDTITIFHWHVTIEGKQDGSILFNIKGKARKDIYKNRAGFCILHPTQNTAGNQVQIKHPDQSISNLYFPFFISPNNPFTNVKEMYWKVERTFYTLFFEGDFFETEDQRNWTDASFKTFCTPLVNPFPVLLHKNDEVNQQVVLKPHSKIQSIPINTTIEFHFTDKKLSFPFIGLSSAPDLDTDNEYALQKLNALRINYYRIELDLEQPDWVSKFSNEAVIANKLNTQLEVVLHLGTKFIDQLDIFCMLVKQNKLTIKFLLLLSKGLMTTNQEVINYTTRLKEQLRNTKIGAGTQYNFTELNRNRFIPGTLDFISYAIHPQEHAFDDLSLIETLHAQRDTVASAKSIYTMQEIHVSPITLRKRFNPYATNPTQHIQTDIQQYDPRQATQFCSLWTLGSIKHLSEAGAAAITYYQTWGKQGILSHEGMPFPVYDVFKKLLNTNLVQVQENNSTYPLLVEGLFFENGEGIIWNYSTLKQRVVLPHNQKVVHLDGLEIKQV